jgi:hypothetical protein
MQLTINIDTSSIKAQAFIDFIKTLDYIKITENVYEESFVLTDGQKSILDERKQRHLKKESKSYIWGDVMYELRNSPK